MQWAWHIHKNQAMEGRALRNDPVGQFSEEARLQGRRKEAVKKIRLMKN